MQSLAFLFTLGSYADAAPLLGGGGVNSIELDSDAVRVPFLVGVAGVGIKYGRFWYFLLLVFNCFSSCWSDTRNNGFLIKILNIFFYIEPSDSWPGSNWAIMDLGCFCDAIVKISDGRRGSHLCYNPASSPVKQ